MCVLIGSLNSEYPWIFTVLGFKMAPCFATVSKDKILEVNEAAAPVITKRETKFGLSAFTGR